MNEYLVWSIFHFLSRKMIDEDEEVLKIRTLYYTDSFLKSKECPQMLPVYQNTIWNFKMLSLFLNEMNDFTIKDHFIYINKEGHPSFHFKSNKNEDHTICITISNIICVSVSLSLLTQEWNQNTVLNYSNIGSRNYILKTYRLQKHTQFFKNFNKLTFGSKSLLYKNDFVYNSKYDFSKIFHFFSKRIISLGLPKNEMTSFLFSYVDSFCNSGKFIPNSLDDLYKCGMRGYFKFELQPKTVKKKLPTFIEDDIEYYITSGVYIFPQSFSLFENDSFNYHGFILDTTWRILPYFVTSKITVSFKNTILPIGFVFGHGETIKSYTFLLKTIEKKLNISFERKILESDQGGALLSIAKSFKFQHLTCLRHFLYGLKKLDYFYQIKYLLRVTSNFEWENSIDYFSKSFKKICDKNPEEILKINNTLEKAGLFFDGNIIFIENDELWDEVSMHRRVNYNMPSTTNTLESMHGHLNKRTPRKNTFYSAILRVHNELSKKFIEISNRIKHNYNYLKNATKAKRSMYSDDELQKMCHYYHTTLDECLCSDNKLESSNYEIDLPCFHRLFKGKKFPDLPETNFNFDDFNQLNYECAFIPGEIIHHPKGYDEKKYCIRTIKHFSKYDDEDDIKNFVEEHMNEQLSGFYIRNQKVSVIQVIEEGVYHFKYEI